MTSKLRILPLGELVAQRAWGQLVTIALVALALIGLPLALGFDHRVTNVAVFAAIYATMALGLNVVVGQVGLLDLGYVTFLATGAIVTFVALLVEVVPADVAPEVAARLGVVPGDLILPVGGLESLGGPRPFDFPGSYLVIILLAGVLCALIGVLRGIPTLRLTGDYYAIVTLGIAEIVFLIYLNTASLTGGAYGMKLSAATRPVLFERLYWDSAAFYYLVLFALGLTLLVLFRLDHSRIGRAWAAIRLDEVAARACGVDVAREKMVAFAISGFFGGVGGALFAVWLGTVAVKALDIWQSVLILCAVVLGGMGSLRGVLLGSVILFSLREVLREDVTLGSALGFALLVAAACAWALAPARFAPKVKAAVAGALAAAGVLLLWLGPARPRFGIPPEASFLVYGLLLVVVMRFRPQGLLPRGAGESTPVTAGEEAELRAAAPRLFALGEPRE